MIAAWMLGSTVFAFLLCVAAFAAERALRLTGQATRTPWAVALILTFIGQLATMLSRCKVLKSFFTAD